MKNSLLALLLLGSILGATEIYAQPIILTGSDLWTTPDGGQSTHSFANDPIPAGFFGAGSEPYNGTVCLKGLPFKDNPGLNPQGVNDLGMTDTIIERLDDMSLQQPGDTATTSIEMTALSLVSCEPITVMFNGAETRFDVEVQLPQSFPQPQGSMTITLDDKDGGTFNSTLPANVNFFFINPASGTFVGAQNRNVILTAQNQPWQSAGNGLDLVTITNPLELGPGTGIIAPPTSPNFHAGVTINPRTQLPKCVLTRFTSPLNSRDQLPAFNAPPPDFDGDSIHDVCDNCPITANPLQDDADKNCIGASCEHAARIAYIGWGDDEKYDQFIDIGNADPDIPLEAVFGTINVGQPPNPIWQRGSRTIEGDFVFSATDGVLPQDGFL